MCRACIYVTSPFHVNLSASSSMLWCLYVHLRVLRSSLCSLAHITPTYPCATSFHFAIPIPDPSTRFLGARHPSSRHSTLLRYLYLTFTRTSLSPFCPPASPPPPRPTRPHLGYVSTTPTIHAHDHCYDHDALESSNRLLFLFGLTPLDCCISMTCRLEASSNGSE